MINVEILKVCGWEEAIKGMRNAFNSHDRSDSMYIDDVYTIGEKDRELMEKLNKNGAVHAKFLRMINVYMDITAPLYWWKEYDTYKVGTVALSESTMHCIHKNEFTIDDFSHDHLIESDSFDPMDAAFIKLNNGTEVLVDSMDLLKINIQVLNYYRQRYLDTKNKIYWWQMIQLLPSSYNQTRTVMLNYEVLHGMNYFRHSHKLDEWVEMCKKSIEKLPESQLITNKRIPDKYLEVTPDEKEILELIRNKFAISDEIKYSDIKDFINSYDGRAYK